MSAFEVADLVTVAARALGLEPDAALDLIDLDAAERALSDARRWCDRDPVEQGAAALLAGLVRHRPVARGNEVVALVATLQFLALRGWDLDLDPPPAARDLVRGVAAGAVGPQALEGWVAGRLRRRDGAHAKEEGMLRRLTRIGRGQPCPEPLGQPHPEPLGDLSPLFTERARRSLALAQQEARGLGHNYLGTEHLLLGLLVEGDGMAARALDALGVAASEVRVRVEALIGRGPAGPAQPPEAGEARAAEPGEARTPVEGEAEPAAAGEATSPETRQAITVPATPRTKKVLELALREAKRLGHDYVGTEHLLLALVREGQGVAAMVLTRLGADPARVHEQVRYLLTGAPLPGAESKQRRSLLLDQMTAVLDENERLLAEVARLHALLREHGIEPDGTTTRTA